MRRIRSNLRIAASDELTVPQFRILAHIRGGLRHVGEIADLTDVSQPAMSKMVDGLVSRGLIRREPDRQDRRLIALRLTPKGSTLFRHVQKTAQKRLGEQLQSLNSSEKRSLIRALNLIESVLSDNKEGA